MSAICPANSARDETNRSDAAFARGAGQWLSLAAAPTFTLMALATAALGGSDPLCSAEHASIMGGMVPMYLLMGAFHSGPWLRLVFKASD